ncbi:ribonucleoside-diphosphate reductase, beta subunit [Ancylostoma ceylanicum]|uniref:Ribonucleoside-diphosphate reductase, beta subunit n=1 Tax=Ancylostoma ceylanicum TaxID=53326 RepID=A0A0D6L419_9BILA|nr:ribonucleoside-diphosphate reductase, beta subunit [Ancylostoma ceylanicum]
METVEKDKTENSMEGKNVNQAPFPVHRPVALEAEVVRFQNNKEKWIAFIGLIDGRPYEIFTGLLDDEDGIAIPRWVDNGIIIKDKENDGSSRYDFQYKNTRGYKTTIEGLSYKFNPEYWNYAKLLSGTLRYGMPIEKKLMDIPVIRERVEYLSGVLQDTRSEDRKKYVISLILFSILIENVSLFSQFAIILSFTRFKGYMKNVSNIIAWTSIDEQIHANGGIYIVNTIREEFPDFFDAETVALIRKTVEESIEVERKILDWIFIEGEIEIVKKKDLLNFMKFRVDESMKQIGFDPIFNITNAEYQPMSWFEEEVFANSLDDFFAKRPVDYTKHDKSITADDLF